MVQKLQPLLTEITMLLISWLPLLLLENNVHSNFHFFCILILGIVLSLFAVLHIQILTAASISTDRLSQDNTSTYSNILQSDGEQTEP